MYEFKDKLLEYNPSSFRRSWVQNIWKDSHSSCRNLVMGFKSLPKGSVFISTTSTQENTTLSWTGPSRGPVYLLIQEPIGSDLNLNNKQAPI